MSDYATAEGPILVRDTPQGIALVQAVQTIAAAQAARELATASDEAVA